MLLPQKVESQILENKSAEGRSRTDTGVSPVDFESTASAISPLRHSGVLFYTMGGVSPRRSTGLLETSGKEE